MGGQKNAIADLQEKIHSNDKVIWVHAASLGEYEQGLPLIDSLRTNYPDHKIVLSFFSPSGYEVQKDTKMADAVCYLPLDSRKNARRFISSLNPSLAVFIKYEIWPNYLRELEARGVRSVLVSARFHSGQVYFKPYGGFMRRVLKKVNWLFVQNDVSRDLLATLGLSNVTVTGDTRFDRVAEILKRDNSLDFMEGFKAGHFCIVAGSTWAEDIAVMADKINTSTEDIKYVLAPHNIDEEQLSKLEKTIVAPTIRFSRLDGEIPDGIRVLILDTIGMLTKVYSYADLAYVGGGFATGLHNTLEPAVFGIPVLIGPNYSGFQEAKDLVELGGIRVVQDSRDFSTEVQKLVADSRIREAAGQTNAAYIAKRQGATQLIIDKLTAVLSDRTSW